MKLAFKRNPILFPSIVLYHSLNPLLHQFIQSCCISIIRPGFSDRYGFPYNYGQRTFFTGRGSAPIMATGRMGVPVRMARNAMPG